MRVLIVGTGSIGRRHIGSLRAILPAVQVDLLREGGRSRAGMDGGLDASVSTSLDEALAKQPQLLVIATPSSVHMRYIEAALRHRIPFYVEKPLVTREADFLSLRKLATPADQPPSMVGCNLRFLPSLQRLRELVRAGELGTVVRASFEAGQWLPDWRPGQDYRLGYSAQLELGGGVLFDLIHEVDAACWLLGHFEQALALRGQFSRLEIDTEDCAAMLLGRTGGPLVTVQLDYVSRRPVRRYVLVGDQATAEWDLQAQALVLRRPGGDERVALPPDAFDVAATYPAAMRELLDAVAHGRPTSQPLAEGLRALELVLRARKSELLT